MKQYVDLSLLALLIIFMYETPPFLNDIVNNTLGKLALLGGVVFLLYKFGNTSGILAALIFIILIHKKQEGFEITIAATREGAVGKKAVVEKKSKKKSKEKSKKKSKKKEDEDVEDNDSEKETFKNFSSDDHIKLNDLEEVNTVPKGINFRNRTDLDRDLKINAEKNKVEATSTRVDGTL